MLGDEIVPLTDASIGVVCTLCSALGDRRVRQPPGGFGAAGPPGWGTAKVSVEKICLENPSEVVCHLVSCCTACTRIVSAARGASTLAGGLAVAWGAPLPQATGDMNIGENRIHNGNSATSNVSWSTVITSQLSPKRECTAAVRTYFEVLTCHIKTGLNVGGGVRVACCGRRRRVFRSVQ